MCNAFADAQDDATSPPTKLTGSPTFEDVLGADEKHQMPMKRNSSLISFACEGAIDGDERALSDRGWRGRSFGCSMDAEEDAYTLSLRFTASECDLVGMGLQYIPVTCPSSPVRREPKPSEQPAGRVHRVVKVRIGSIGSLTRRTERGLALTVFLWLLSTAGAAMVAAHVFSRGGLNSARALSSTVSRATVLDRAGRWTEALDHRPFSGLFDPTNFVDPATLSDYAHAARTSLTTLQMHAEQMQMQLSPLAEQRPEGRREEVAARASRSAPAAPAKRAPELPIAAVGFASAVASVLTPGGKPAATSEQWERWAARHSEKRAAASWVRDDGREGARDEPRLDVGRAVMAAHLAGATYYSCDDSNAAAATDKLTAHLQEHGLELVSELRGTNDEYGYVARHEASRSLHVIFRGSCTLQNVFTDLRYKDAKGVAVQRFVKNLTGLRVPDHGMQLHRGFVEAYLALREQLIEVLEEELDGHPARSPSAAASEEAARGSEGGAAGAAAQPMSVHLSGHSMGGAVAMLAALEVENRRRCGQLPAARVQTLTFAAPRVGDRAFAEMYERAFKGDDHWALQVPSDAVPHLPFEAWGFRHPHGVVLLGGHGAADMPIGTGRPLRRSADRGDSVDLLRPKDGDVHNWAACHDLQEYLAHLYGVANGQAGEMEYGI